MQPMVQRVGDDDSALVVDAHSMRKLELAWLIALLAELEQERAIDRRRGSVEFEYKPVPRLYPGLLAVSAFVSLDHVITATRVSRCCPLPPALLPGPAVHHGTDS